MDELAVQRVRSLLLKEVKTGKMEWYYISMASGKFAGGFFLEARGPTEAWTLFHRLGWFEEGNSTQTTGPCDPEAIKKIPDMLWRKVSKQEIETIDRRTSSAENRGPESNEPSSGHSQGISS